MEAADWPPEVFQEIMHNSLHLLGANYWIFCPLLDHKPDAVTDFAALHVLAIVAVVFQPRLLWAPLRTF